MQPGARIRRRGVKGSGGSNSCSVLAAASQNAVEARRGDRIVLVAEVGPDRRVLFPWQGGRGWLSEATRRQAKHQKQIVNRAFLAGGHISRARVGAPDMGADWAG